MLKKIFVMCILFLLSSFSSYASIYVTENEGEYKKMIMSSVPTISKYVNYGDLLKSVLLNYNKNVNDEKMEIEKNLKEIDLYEKFRIEINKDDKMLKFYGDDKLIAKFKASIGKDTNGTKEIEGDNKTPEGIYYICEKHISEKYNLFMGISYPNIIDAKSGYDKGFISKYEFEEIERLINEKKVPLWNTKLGGVVGIHGGGSDVPSTRGCIQLNNDEIEFLWKYTNVGTEVVIE